MIKVLFICHGNICRSTMAESIFTHLVKERGLSDVFRIDSAATSREEIGNPPHYGTVARSAAGGYSAGASQGSSDDREGL